MRRDQLLELRLELRLWQWCLGHPEWRLNTEYRGTRTNVVETTSPEGKVSQREVVVNLGWHVWSCPPDLRTVYSGEGSFYYDAVEAFLESYGGGSSSSHSTEMDSSPAGEAGSSS
jgi:hypothetical protein